SLSRQPEQDWRQEFSAFGWCLQIRRAPTSGGNVLSTVQDGRWAERLAASSARMHRAGLAALQPKAQPAQLAAWQIEDWRLLPGARAETWLKPEPMLCLQENAPPPESCRSA